MELDQADQVGMLITADISGTKIKHLRPPGFLAQADLHFAGFSNPEVWDPARLLSGELLDARLEVGAGLSSASWTEVGRIAQPQVSTTLGSWDSTSVEDGTYTLRLTIRDRQLGLAEITTVLTVRNETDED